MSLLGQQIIDDAVKKILGCMREDRFSREELEILNKIFQEAANVTRKTIEKGPKSSNDSTL